MEADTTMVLSPRPTWFLRVDTTTDDVLALHMMRILFKFSYNNNKNSWFHFFLNYMITYNENMGGARLLNYEGQT